MSREGLHVLLTADTVGGVWDFACVLGSELRRRATRVTLLALGTPTAQQHESAKASADELVTAPLRLEWMQGSAADIERTRDVVREVAHTRGVDLVHASQYAAVGAVDLPVVLTIHSDVISWHRWTRQPDARELASLRRSPYAQLVRQAIARADHVVAVSASVAADVRGSYGLERHVDVIHNGWPASDPPLPIAARGRRTLLAGRVWDEAKNLSFVARGARGWPSGEVVLAGEQRHPETGSISEVPAPVRPLGFLAPAELEAELRRSRVYCAPARYEPFGLLALQAALSGCALLLHDIPPHRELWDGAGVFFSDRDEGSLQRAWSSLLDHDVLAQAIAAAARDRALTRYGSARMAERYLDVYARCARGAVRSRVEAG